MRDPTVALYVLGGLVMLATAWRLSRMPDAGTALVAAGAQLLLLASATLVMPPFTWWFPQRSQHWIFVGVVVVTVVTLAAAAGRSTRPGDRVVRWLRSHPRAGRVMLAATAIVLTLGALEFLASSAVRAGLARRYTPTETVVAEQTEDWRLAHVMSDDYREPDPVLLWRPVARTPYTSQRFRGPDVSASKPAGVIRIICYGDSNTDGPLEGGAWPAALATLLSTDGGSAYEVLNAGVTGYSSYQGRLRFEQEADTYRPDIVILSFGWNDAANAIGAEDKAFAATDAFRAADSGLVRLRRWLFRYDAALVAARLFSRPFVVPQGVADAPHGPRVTLSDYEANLRAIVGEARTIDTRVVLMTRPHLEPESDLANAPGWRRRVPAYNAVVRRLAADLQVPFVDAQRVFEPTPELFVDGAHLSRAGHRRLAEEVVSVLQSAGLIQ